MATNPFVPGDLVISVYGDGDGSGNYGDNQAAPITLEDVTVTGTVVNKLVLPQTASTNAAGVKESAISGEYGSSSEGTLERSADGQSLVIAGYGVNAATYNSGGASVYGNAALAQSTSVQGGQYTAVPRVIADIRYDGTMDTSTALYNVDNTNNPRSVATTDGSSFYLSGQGVKGDSTQGLFYAKDGASSATPINTQTDTRTVELYNGNVYVSTDSKQGPTSNISMYSGEPTSSSTPTVLPGINNSVTLTAAQQNSVNSASVGKKVFLSPENYYFANSTTLYVADSGSPKQGGIGDGGLQKWIFSSSTSTWSLQYTLSSGLNLVANSASAGTTGLTGLTGSVSNGVVSLYATNYTINDLDQSYLFGINDTLTATTPGPNESFSTLVTAAADTKIAGVAFAPICFARGTLISTPRGEVAVEALLVGDEVLTSSGEARPIIWIGRRSIDCRSYPVPADAWPVRIAAHAFGANRPTRDLYLSPQHAVAVTCLDEVLIPVKYLINGGTVAQIARNTMDYFHLELDQHDLVLAENLAAESFLDTQGRAGFFDNGADYAAAHPDQPLQPMSAFCRPLVLDGPVIAAARAQLQRRMELNGWTLSSEADLHLLADGVRLEGLRAGDRCRFVVPAATRELRLRSRSFVPAQVDASSGDGRRLGVPVAGIAMADGFNTRSFAMGEDAALGEGFSFLQDADGLAYRWTDGDAGLDSHAWEDAQDDFFLTVTLAPRCGYRGWNAPSPAAKPASCVVDLEEVRLRSAA